MKALKWPLVRVRWLDSSSPHTGWTSISQWKGLESLECVSVGYVIAEDAISKTIAPHLAYPEEENCQGNGIIVIPLGVIISVDLLTVAAAMASCEETDRSSGPPESCQPNL